MKLPGKLMALLLGLNLMVTVKAADSGKGYIVIDIKSDTELQLEDARIKEERVEARAVVVGIRIGNLSEKVWWIEKAKGYHEEACRQKKRVY